MDHSIKSENNNYRNSIFYFDKFKDNEVNDGGTDVVIKADYLGNQTSRVRPRLSHLCPKETSISSPLTGKYSVLLGPP